MNSLNQYIEKIILLSRDILELSLPEDLELLLEIVHTRETFQKKVRQLVSKNTDFDKLFLKNKLKIIAEYDQKIISVISKGKEKLKADSFILKKNGKDLNKFNSLKKSNLSTFDREI